MGGRLSIGKPRVELYTRYPRSSVLTYNAATLLRFVLGGIGIVLGYGYSWVAYPFGAPYLGLSLVEMYAVMPLKVCPSCVYYRLKGSLCVSGLNVLSRRLAREGKPEDFPRRAQGLLCPNNLYMASLVIPVIALLPALFNPSLLLVVVLVGLVALLLFRFFVIFPRIARLHCRAKFKCPQAEAMGVRER